MSRRSEQHGIEQQKSESMSVDEAGSADGAELVLIFSSPLTAHHGRKGQ